jgi:endonuclease G
MVDFYLKIALLIILNTFMVSGQALATSIFSKHCPLGCPVSNDDNFDIVIHNTHISAINKKTKWTIWTSYEVDKKFFGKRKNHSFIADPLLPERLQKKPLDYKGLYKKHRISRGHMAPASHFSSEDGIARQTYYLSNIQPQHMSLNAGIWSKIEKWERKNSPLYVISGATDKKNLLQKKFWKLILNKQKNIFYAFVIKQNGEKYCYENILISDLEKLTKLEFFKYYKINQKRLIMSGKGKC